MAQIVVSRLIIFSNLAMESNKAMLYAPRYTHNKEVPLLPINLSVRVPVVQMLMICLVARNLL